MVGWFIDLSLDVPLHDILTILTFVVFTPSLLHAAAIGSGNVDFDG